MYLLFETSPDWSQGWRDIFFFYLDFGCGAVSSNVLIICAVYWSLGRRGYFGFSNVVLVRIWQEDHVSYNPMSGRVVDRYTNRSNVIMYTCLGVSRCRHVRRDRLPAVAGKTFPAFPTQVQRSILRIWQEAHGLIIQSDVWIWELIGRVVNPTCNSVIAHWHIVSTSTYK